jgi:hypothetical protein
MEFNSQLNGTRTGLVSVHKQEEEPIERFSNSNSNLTNGYHFSTTSYTGFRSLVLQRFFGLIIINNINNSVAYH